MLAKSLTATCSFLDEECSGSSASNLGDSDDAAKAQKQLEEVKKTLGADSPLVKKAEEAQANLGGAVRAAYGGLLVAVLSLLVMILTFAKKSGPLVIVGGLTILASVVFILISPSYDTGKYGPANARQIAMLYGIPALIGGLCGILADKFRKPA